VVVSQARRCGVAMLGGDGAVVLLLALQSQRLAGTGGEGGWVLLREDLDEEGRLIEIGMSNLVDHRLLGEIGTVDLLLLAGIETGDGQSVGAAPGQDLGRPHPDGDRGQGPARALGHPLDVGGTKNSAPLHYMAYLCNTRTSYISCYHSDTLDLCSMQRYE